jgi:hypothetical protein
VADDSTNGLAETEREVARGRSARTPVLALGAVTLVIAAVFAIVVAAALLAWLLA